MSNQRNDIGINKNDALNSLDRIISFINICDNKASIMLGVFGVIITLICTTGAINEIIRILDAATKSTLFYNIIYTTLLLASIAAIFIGLYKFISVLLAKTKTNDIKQNGIDLDSKIYFGHIAKTKSYEQYKKKVLSCDYDAFINDITSQIYINALICDSKFKKYNLGFMFSATGLVSFLFLWILGYYIY